MSLASNSCYDIMKTTLIYLLLTFMMVGVMADSQDSCRVNGLDAKQICDTWPKLQISSFSCQDGVDGYVKICNTFKNCSRYGLAECETDRKKCDSQNSVIAFPCYLTYLICKKFNSLNCLAEETDFILPKLLQFLPEVVSKLQLLIGAGNTLGKGASTVSTGLRALNGFAGF